MLKELIIGGHKSGKSKAAEDRARSWLKDEGREAVLIATAFAGDPEMAARIERHRKDREHSMPGLKTLECTQHLVPVLKTWSAAPRLLIIDCLTLWLTQVAMPLHAPPPSGTAITAAIDDLVAATAVAPGPLVFVTNEIGWGVIPVSAEVRVFLDHLGRLHQRIAALCDRMTIMVAGCELPIPVKTAGS